MVYPTVAIIGRPNVGKSSFFNRLVGKKFAIISDVAGTTRDRIYDTVLRKDFAYFLVDTGGIMDLEGEIEANVQAQAHQAIADADVIVFMLDGRDELTIYDREIFTLLEQGKKPFMVVINKCDNENLQEQAMSFYELGVEELLFVSASHGLGVEEFETALKKIFRKEQLLFPPMEDEEGREVTKIALVGAPNAGKSSLINNITGDSRVIVSEIPGTTRDATDTEYVYNGKPYLLIDTAGLRRPGRIEHGIEKYSVLRTMRAISRSDVVLLLFDAKRGITQQEKSIIAMIQKEQRGIILVVNKWDLVEKDEKTMDKFISYMQYHLPFLAYAPVLFVSAVTGQRVLTVFDLVDKIVVERAKRIETGELNRFFEMLVTKRPPHGTKQTLPKLKYVTQVSINPPKFLLFVNSAPAFHFSYVRYLENQLRERYGFEGTPIILELKEGVDRHKGEGRPKKEKSKKYKK